MQSPHRYFQWFSKRDIFILLVLAYGASFLGLRHRGSIRCWVDAVDDSIGSRTINVHWFSKNRTWNKNLWYFYWPIHGLVLGIESESSEVEFKNKQAQPHQKTIYVRDINWLVEGQFPLS